MAEKLGVGAIGAQVARLHEELQQHNLEVPVSEVRREFFGPGTREAVLACQRQHGLTCSGEVDESTAALLSGNPIPRAGRIESPGATAARAVTGTSKPAHQAPSPRAEEASQRTPTPAIDPVPGAERPPGGGRLTGAGGAERSVSGRILLEHGVPAANVKLRLYQRGFGGAATLLKEVRTDERGLYDAHYVVSKGLANIEICAVVGDREIPLSKTKFAVGEEAVLNLVAPTSLIPSAPEYTRLSADMIREIGNMANLAGARESSEHHDLSALNAATGWDARAIALAATAQKLQADSHVGLSAQALYGLFRAGLPTDKLMLAQVDPETVGLALENLDKRGIIDLGPEEIAAFKRDFKTFADTVRLAVPAPGAETTYGQLLDAADIGDDREKFAQVFINHRGDPADIWQAARAAHVDNKAIGKLQWQGKLAFLAGNSGTVTRHLMQKLVGAPLHPGEAPQLSSPVELIDQDLYEPEQWKTELRGLARNDDELMALIPVAYGGKTVDDRLDAYSEDMARKLRISYPTQVVTRMVENDALQLDGAKDATVKLLQGAMPQGFKLGATPVAAFFESGVAALPADMTDHDLAAAMEQVKTLQRVYQITPNNVSMPVLVALGLTSAYDVTSLREDEFYTLFSDKYVELYHRPPSKPEIELVWRKAQQVSCMTYNIFAVTKKLDSDPPLPAISGTPDKHAAQKKGLKEALKGYPTMEQLFGSLDFCECEHCRSLLSPAAYLVDLLQFVEAEPQARANFLKRWKDRNGTAYSDRYLAPYDALIKRRPDLPHISLTCENTNVALPYIDIVNEILEYYIANNTLTKDAARNTGEGTSTQLLAEPQNVITEAYIELLKDRYPLNLPFDLWLETVRQFCNYSETPLPTLLDTFRPTEKLFDAGHDYDRSAIFIESLGLSPAERTIITDPNPLATWWELYGYATVGEAQNVVTDPDTQQRIDLNSAKVLSRRLGVTYKELVELVKTQFVNPHLAGLALLYQLPASIVETKFFLDPENQGFYTANKDLLEKNLNATQTARLKALSKDDWKKLSDLGGYADRVTAHAAAYHLQETDVLADLAALPLDKALVLVDPDTGCNFDATTLRYADTKPADPATFLRLNLFVRLWRKLGWSIAETDHALRLFVPAEAPYDEVHFGRKPLDTALIYLAHLKELDGRVKVGKPSRIKLLTLWSDIPTEGKNSLYSQLFLTRSILQADPIFDHPQGDYLAPAWIAAHAVDKPADFVLLKGHLLAIQAALGLTPGEVDEIFADAGTSIDTAELSLPQVSLLYRYGLLAKAQKISVHDLISLKTLAHKNPFRPLDPQPLSTLDQDYPFVETLELLDIAEQVKQSGLTIEDLDFLLRRHFDEFGLHRRDRHATLALLRTLADGVRAIRTEHPVPTDPTLLTEEFLQQKLGRLLSPSNVEQLLRMLRGQEELNALTRAFFDNVLKKRQVRLPEEAGFLTEADYPGLFDPLEKLEEVAPTDTQEQIEAKREKNEKIIASNRTETQRRWQRTAEAFLPVLQNRLVRQLVVQTLAAESGADPALVESLLVDTRLLAIDGEPLLNTLMTAGAPGVDADFYTSTDGTGPRQPTAAQAGSADTALKDIKDPQGNNLPAANSARFVGYLVAPATGTYRLYVQLDKTGAEARLTFPHLPQPLFLQGTAQNPPAPLGMGQHEYLDLKTGVPYRFELALDKLDGGGARLLVQGERSPRGSLAQLDLYSAATLDAAEKAHELLSSALVLLDALGLTERETRYILTHPAQWGGVNLSGLPTDLTDRTEDTPEQKVAAVEHFGQFRRLAAYAQLKRELAGGTDDLIGVFEANGTTEADRLPKTVYPLIARLTRRDVTVVQATAEALFTAPNFANDEQLRQLWEALQLVERLGATPTALRGWTRILASRGGGPAPAGDPHFEIARGIKGAIKSRYDPETWQRVAQPIFDQLRRRQRDALVGHIMHRENFTRVEQLYEYFLVDPGMEPVVQTSRIRLAIGSVQLFVQRCLLNLEREVHPSAILNADQWDWMKRYRVWEANRKIFLFPENWLEPEFRDDKTHLFTELESALMQGDVTADRVDDAFLNYLRKLEELARLDIVAMHLEDKPDFSKNTLHVIGRTFSVPHKYFYRRFANHIWSPWEPVGAEIEGDHLAPVVWRNRLYLFWLTFLESGKPFGTGPADTNELNKLPTVQRTVEVQLHWSEYIDGEWSTHESGGYSAPAEERITTTVYGDFVPQQVFVHVKVVEDPEPDQETLALTTKAGVYITLGQPFGQEYYLAGRNSSPVALYGGSPRPLPFYSIDSASPKLRPTRYVGAGSKFSVILPRTSTEPGKSRWDYLDILGQTGAFTLLLCNNTLTMGVSPEAYEGAEKPDEVRQAMEESIAIIEGLMKPVFFQDNNHTLFVEPEVTERTVEEWQEWVTRTPVPELELPMLYKDPKWWDRFVVPIEVESLIPDPLGPVIFPDRDSIIQGADRIDWLINQGTGLLFDGQVIGAQGKAPVEVVSTDKAAELVSRGAATITVNGGSGIPAASTVVVPAPAIAGQTGLAQARNGMNIIGNGGYNAALHRNVEAFTLEGLGRLQRPTGPVQ
ncbi:neuraminidase-like domain-containing protein [Rhodococcus aetherivorans]|uniref:neuraminidase-like domain-containing protein n=1 Tax=Rhodococcus aetherivorans TaxID=191292 RepID=UPI002949134A|nr:neuraminidase-like domain-containing protein [Rhodococcus aetherivorans]MDV6297234.1 neuraminidase-like domain-containing protein [Rhodococcus aetherivorans]